MRWVMGRRRRWPWRTRPLAIQKDRTWYCYGWDLTKNVCEIFGAAGYIRTAYAYTPYGSVTEEGDVTQPLQWSSEYADPELGLVYYNYRYYNPTDGRWIRRDPAKEGINIYLYLQNTVSCYCDYLGLKKSNYKCSEKGEVTNIVITYAMSRGKLGTDPDTSEMIHIGSEVLQYAMKATGKMYKPLKMTASVGEAPKALEVLLEKSQRNNDTLIVVYAKAEFDICVEERCGFLWSCKHIVIKHMKIGYSSSKAVLPSLFEDGKRDAEDKVKRKIKEIQKEVSSN